MCSLFGLVLIFSTLNYVRAATPYQDCGSKLGSIQLLDVPECPTSPCELTKGKTYTITVKFQAKAASKTASLQLSAVVYGIPAKVPLPDADVCNLGAKCPINENDVNTITISLPVHTVYPSISVDLILAVTANDQNEKYICAQAPVSISSS